MATARLNEPLLTAAAPRTAFFNGRLLSAEDLQREQAQRATGDAALARLVGCGIASGLGVSAPWPPAPLLSIEAGQGVTPSGQVLEIEAVGIDLGAQAGAARGGGFANCVAALNDLQAPGAGLYLLVLTPDWRPAGRAATVLGEVGACNRAVEQAAVRVRLVPVKRPDGAQGAASGDDISSPLRNQLALSLLAPRPAQRTDLIGWLPRQRFDGGLSDDDLPLAVLQLDSQARVLFVDAHSAQRRLAPPPGGADDAWWARSGRVEMEAFGQQFIAQLGTMLRRPGLATDTLREAVVKAFPLLPPVALADLQRQPELERLLDLVDQTPHTVSGAVFLDTLEQGLREQPLPVRNARLALLHWQGTERYLLCRTRQAEPPPAAPAAQGEFSSRATATVAAKLLRSKSASAQERQLAGSVLTQARNRKAAPK